VERVPHAERNNIGKFKANLRGELIQRSDERYEEARKLYNGMIDKRPASETRAHKVSGVQQIYFQ
jgi:hypothetical protein